jgi:hypothetical protein
MMKGNGSDVVVGLDLAGVANRPTGFCVLTELRVDTGLVYEDEEIIRKTKQVEPQVVAIDAPLSLLKGRKSIEEKTSTHLRVYSIKRHTLDFWDRKKRGRVSGSVFMRNYFSPALLADLKDPAFKGITSLPR